MDGYDIQVYGQGKMGHGLCGEKNNEIRPKMEENLRDFAS